MQLSDEYTQDVEHRFRYAVWIIMTMFVIVIGRLYYLQVIEGKFYRFFSSENSIKEIKIPAPRGLIFDRRGQVLVDNRPAFDVVLIPQYVLDPPKVLTSLANLLSLPRAELDAIWEKRIGQAKYQPLLVKSDISFDEVAVFRGRKGPWYDETDPIDLRGVEVRTRYQRTSTQGNEATHLLGYVREIDPQRLKHYEEIYPGRYHMGDQIGVRGLEERWDLDLRGEDGFEQRVVNAVGREVDYHGIADQLEHRPAVPGSSLVLTVDRDLQELASSLFGNHLGAAAMVDVRTGEVRMLFSATSYDLNRLSGPEGSAYWQTLVADPMKPLLNRAIQGTYPPGSTYKIVSAIAALAEGVVKPDESIVCRGALMYGGRPYHCWAKGGHGSISLHRALVQSCDVYFYMMGLRLGVDRIAKYATLLGFGRPTGIEMSDEKGGLIPTAAWKQQRFGVPWQEGETLSIVVGQGYDLVTPLQNAMMLARVVNGGREIRPHLVHEVYDVHGKETYRLQLGEASTIPISSQVLEMVKAGLVGVVAEAGGTAHRLSTLQVKIGGKTGTAQVVQLGSSCSGEQCRDHAWFVGFAPAEAPEVAAAVIVEHGGFGASAAAPIVGALLQKYYDIEAGM